MCMNGLPRIKIYTGIKITKQLNFIVRLPAVVSFVLRLLAVVLVALFSIFRVILTAHQWTEASALLRIEV